MEAHYRFVLWLIPTVERFPRSQKFLLGDRIQSTALDVLERLIEATYTRRRSSHLAAANLGLEKLRFLVRLARDLQILDARRYEHAARNILVQPAAGLVWVGERSVRQRHGPGQPCGAVRLIHRKALALRPPMRQGTGIDDERRNFLIGNTAFGKRSKGIRPKTSRNGLDEVGIRADFVADRTVAAKAFGRGAAKLNSVAAIVAFLLRICRQHVDILPSGQGSHSMAAPGSMFMAGWMLSGY